MLKNQIVVDWSPCIAINNHFQAFERAKDQLEPIQCKLLDQYAIVAVCKSEYHLHFLSFDPLFFFFFGAYKHFASKLLQWKRLHLYGWRLEINGYGCTFLIARIYSFTILCAKKEKREKLINDERQNSRAIMNLS